MADTHTWTLTCKPSGLPTVNATAPQIVTGQFSEDIDDTVLAGTTKKVFSGSIDHTKVISFVLHSTQVATTVNTNSVDGTGGQSFALGADKDVGWYNGMPISTLLTADITGIWVVNAGAKDTNFRGSFLLSLS